MPAGYSKNPLIVKLGIKPGMRVRLVNEPAHYFDLIGPLPDGVTMAKASRGVFDFIHLFATSAKELDQVLPVLKKSLAKDGALWISWPKKTSKIKHDVGEAIVREAGLEFGMVDVKICAVDEDWSGLKFVWRLKDRYNCAEKRYHDDVGYRERFAGKIGPIPDVPFPDAAFRQ